MFERVTLIGIGLIGSSIARALRKAAPDTRIHIADRSEAHIERARALGLGDAYDTDAAAMTKKADLVILCVPVGAMGELAKQIAPELKLGAILSDVGSVKQAVINDVRPHIPPHAEFIPAHPIAGTEYSGPEAGFASLFENRWVIMSPLDDQTTPKVEAFKNLWQSFGAKIAFMPPERHDTVLAITSHIPHLIAYSIVGTASDFENVSRQEVVKFSAAGFRDFTRIAASDPIMWRDIFLTNKPAVLEMLGRTIEDLVALQRLIRWGDGEALETLFTRTGDIRRSIIEEGQDTAIANFGRHNQNNIPTEET